MVAFGKIAKNYQKAKRIVGKAAHSGLIGSRWLGKGFGQIHKTYRIGKTFARHGASKLDKKLGTRGAFRSIADRGIEAVGSSVQGRAIKAGLEEAESQNKRLQLGLRALGGR